MASSAPSPLKTFLAQSRKAVGAFVVGAVGTVATALSSAYAVSGQLDKIDPYALAVAAVGAGLAAAAAIYKVANRPPSIPGPVPQPPQEGPGEVPADLPPLPESPLDPASVARRADELLRHPQVAEVAPAWTAPVQ